MRASARDIRRKLRTLRRRWAAQKAAGLSAALTRYAETGELPSDPMSRSFIEMCQAGQRAMDASIGGGPEHDKACQEFAELYERWGRLLRESGA